MITINKIVAFLEFKYKFNCSWLVRLPSAEQSNPNAIERRIRELLGNTTLTLVEKNSIAKCLIKTYLNHKHGNIPKADLSSLSDYIKIHCIFRVKISQLKSLLESELYLIDGLPTSKSFSKNLVFTKFRNRGEIIQLWNVSFLDKLVNKNAGKFNFQKKSNIFKAPKNNKEGLMEVKKIITKLNEEWPYLKINPNSKHPEILDYLLQVEAPNAKFATQVSHLIKHIEHIKNHTTITIDKDTSL